MGHHRGGRQQRQQRHLPLLLRRQPRRHAVPSCAVLMEQLVQHGEVELVIGIIKHGRPATAAAIATATARACIVAVAALRARGPTAAATAGVADGVAAAALALSSPAAPRVVPVQHLAARPGGSLELPHVVQAGAFLAEAVGAVAARQRNLHALLVLLAQAHTQVKRGLQHRRPAAGNAAGQLPGGSLCCRGPAPRPSRPGALPTRAR